MMLHCLAIASCILFGLIQKCGRFICFFGGEKTKIFFRERDKTHWENTLADAVANRNNSAKAKDSPIYWVHVASAGELEQIIPILRSLHEKHGVYFFLTYFSPSARSFVKNCPGLLAATSLPFENPSAYVKALTALQIKRLLLVRYDFWPMLIHTLRDRGCACAVVAATINEARAVGPVFLSRRIKAFWFQFTDCIFVVSEEDGQALTSLGITKKKLFVAGDAKWSRAKERAQSAHQAPSSERMLACRTLIQERRTSAQASVIVFGSPHDDETEVIERCLSSNTKNEIFLVAPSEVDEKTIASLEKRFIATGASVSRLTQNVPLPSSEKLTAQGRPWVLLLDCFGFLAEAYAFADLAVVGGGFDGQLHNVLEPAAHGTVTLFGSRTRRSLEAQQLVNAGGALTFSNPNELFQFLDRWVKLKESSKQEPEFTDKLSGVRETARNLFGSLPDTSEVVCRVLSQQDNLKTL
ncbi:MAG: hypothetical protein RIR26_73 [Pseudomonadota bacterium]|jgi:3-deoxy-D-manno-octulosonic-acid transferase